MNSANPAGDGPTQPAAPTFRSGFGCLVGRPNTGKSTLTNALVGQKVAIASSRPQTTRHAVRGIVHRPEGQLVVVDTPGLHRPRTLLGERLNTLVRDTWSKVDVVAVCFAADQRIGPGDAYLTREVAALPKRKPRFAVATKADTVGPDRMAEHLVAIARVGAEAGMEFDEILPCSAVTGAGVDLLASLMTARLPEGPPLYPDGELTDEPEQVLVAELIREAALEGVRDELPHSIAVEIAEMGLRQPNRPEQSEVARTGSAEVNLRKRPEAKRLIDIYATIYVERSSQKPIVVGRGGARLRDVGTKARQSIEALLGERVYLDLHVKVLSEWQRNPKYLRRLGF